MGSDSVNKTVPGAEAAASSVGTGVAASGGDLNEVTATGENVEAGTTNDECGVQ